MNKLQQLSYEEAITELQNLLQALQGEQISIDQLREKSERASALIQYCQEKLRDLEVTLAPKENK